MNLKLSHELTIKITCLPECNAVMQVPTLHKNLLPVSARLEVHLISVFFWDIMQCRVVILYQHF
jgi:hypothetical protein